MASKKKMVSGVAIKLQAGTDRTYFTTWTWTQKHTDNYKVRWYYGTSQGVWFVGTDTTTAYKQSTYNAPSNATKIKVTIQPIAKKHKVNGKDTAYWTASWSTAVTLELGALPPDKPSTPTVKIENFNLTAEVNYYGDASKIEFEIVQNDKTSLGINAVNIVTNHASLMKTVSAGNSYKVRARALKGSNNRSAWSEYSANAGTIPSTPSKIKSIEAVSETAVRLKWDAVQNATGYVIEYTDNRDYFDTSSEVKTDTVEGTSTTRNIVGLETGKTWYFRLQATNAQGSSGWCSPAQCTIGKAPSMPTTWSSTTTAVAGDVVTLSWVHNSEDNSEQTAAEIELTINEVIQIVKINTDTSYKVNTNGYRDGSTIKWRVRTKGIINKFSEWSIQRNIDVYAPVTLGITGVSDVISAFPFVFQLAPSVGTQLPIGYHVSILALESYETTDETGQDEMVHEGQEIFSRYYDKNTNPLVVEITPGDVNFDNNIRYRMVCTVAMDSGLSAESYKEFEVMWTETSVFPDAEVGIDNTDAVSAFIRPFCAVDSGGLLDSDGDDILDDTNDELLDSYSERSYIEGITLGVYRREFDGTFTQIMTDIPNDGSTVVIDPHPALNYARYRIVAISDLTGSVDYYDVPGYPIQEKAIVLQWDAEWSDFDITGVNDDGADEREERFWSGSLLRLPWNVDVADKNDPDVTLAEYVGRRNPVSYYGTQIGQTSTWSVEIERTDEETLYALRRLAIWMGDVYVREPSGSGYWAHVSVSFSQRHTEMTIPVTLEITRVEGGV